MAKHDKMRVLKQLHTLYQGATTVIAINGELPEAVKLLGGIRQGCCASMLLLHCCETQQAVWRCMHKKGLSPVHLVRDRRADSKNDL